MISDKETIRISKFLSLVLRHQPETIGIELDSNGWTDVATLINRSQDCGWDLIIILFAKGGSTTQITLKKCPLKMTRSNQ